MADTLSRDLAESDYLRRLAARPEEAMDAWRQLNASQQFLVITHMGVFYGVEFVRTFQAVARLPERPAVVITVTNVRRPEYERAALQASGYVLQRGSTSAQYWIHPTGRQIWLLPASISAPPPDLMPETLQPQIAVDDVIAQARELLDRYKYLEQKSMEIKRRRQSRNQSAAEYYRSRAPWWDDYRLWKQRAEALQTNPDPMAVLRLPLGSRAQLQQILNELDRLMNRPPQTMLEPLEAVKPL